ncbi:transmembrane protein 268 [Nematolebias whitei]|uniref:transmembrane protein 268 n=1 Tax=Nematolebias whitei TaxID=451745 RepID=UPI00189A3051|nr:transmembrane protein 268 [Nematolebias whitei]
MEDHNADCQGMEETLVDFRETSTDQLSNNNRPTWSNGQCVVAMRSSSTFNPTFDLSLCRTKLQREGFEIPVRDMEVPLKKALDVPSVRRFMVFNMGFFHFLMAPVMYVVVWCAVFSTFHLYIGISDLWVLCLSVSLVSILLTTALIFILHHSNKEININVDVRLVQVNEMLVKHKLLVGVADWVKNCSGHTQLYFVYWDMSRCLRTLTESLEERCFMTPETQNKLKSRMSHLVLVIEVCPVDPEDIDHGGSGAEQDLDEGRPLLRSEDTRSSNQPGGATVTSSFSLVPEASLPAQAKAHQLLMTYSAAYVKLLMSERLSGPSNCRLRARKNHCTTGPICLCQYTKIKTLL